MPAEKEIRRLVNAALHSFFQDLYPRISSRLPETARAGLDRLLIVPENELVSPFEKLKADPPASGVDNLKLEITKLQQLRALGVTDEMMADIPPEALQMLKRRARNERAGEMREHPADIRRALMACFIYLKAKEVTDDVIRMMMEMIHPIETLTEQQLEREILQDVTCTHREVE